MTRPAVETGCGLKYEQLHNPLTLSRPNKGLSPPVRNHSHMVEIWSRLWWTFLLLSP